MLWARDAGVKVTDGGIVRDLDPTRVEAGDLVVGTLPINLVAEVIRRGGRYLHLALELPPEARGRELSADELRRYGARLEEYDVRALGPLGAVDETGACAGRATEEVMLCIASAQPLANLLPILMRKPVAVYVAVTDDGRAKRTAERIKEISTGLGLPCALEPGTPEAPLASVEAHADALIGRIRARHPGATLVLNATGGTKLISLGFSNRLGPVGKVLYCDTGNDRVEYFHPENHAPDPLPPGLVTLDQLLRAQGIEKIRADSDDPAWLERARSRRALSEALSRFSPNNVFQIINGIAARAAPKRRAGQDKPFEPLQSIKKPLSDKADALFDRIAEHGLWQREGKRQFRLANEEDVLPYLMGGWLEELAALEMEALCERAGIPSGHWAAGLEVRPLDAYGDKTKPFNELDLVVVWRNRLLVIECKTGTQAADANVSMDITNKLEAIRHYLGGPFSSVWLASAQQIPPDSVAAERCRHFGVDIIKPYELHDLGAFIAGWMQLDPALGGRRDWAQPRGASKGARHRANKRAPGKGGSAGAAPMEGAMAEALKRSGIRT